MNGEILWFYKTRQKDFQLIITFLKMVLKNISHNHIIEIIDVEEYYLG